jgi:chromosome segregation ATPase
MDILEETRWQPTELGALALQLTALLARLETVEARLAALEEGADGRYQQHQHHERALHALERRVDGVRGDLRDHEWRHHR